MLLRMTNATRPRPQQPSSLQRELKQRRPFTSPQQEALVALLHTADLVRRHIGRALQPHDVTLQQFNVLRILRGAGEAGLPTLEIAERMIERAPGITRLIDRLETAGLVLRERSTKDRRTVICRATAKALVLLASLDAAVDAADDAALGMLSEPVRRQLIRILDSIRAATP